MDLIKEYIAIAIEFEKLNQAGLSSKKDVKATPHDHRLTPLCAICLPNFRHNTQFYLVLRQ